MFEKNVVGLPVLALLLTVSLSAEAQKVGPSIIPNAYIVKVSDEAEANQVARDVARFTAGSIRHIYTEAFRGFAIRVPPGIGAVDILADPRVIRVEPDLEVSIPQRGQKPPPGKGPGKDKEGGGTQSAQLIPTGVDRIDSDLSATANIDGSDERVNVDIAILDTGIDLDHPDLNVVVGVNFAGGGPNANDKNGHGTHVAGTAAATDNSIGVVYVVAAGNSSKDIYGDDGLFNTSDDFIPAAYPEAATISAMADSDGAAGGIGTITSTGDEDDTIAGFSNFNRQFGLEVFITSSGGAIDLAGPGVDILSTWKDGEYNTLSGTSMATPHITGAVGLYIAVNGRDVNSDGTVDAADVAAIRQAVIDSAEPQSLWSPDTQDPDWNKEALVDAQSF